MSRPRVPPSHRRPDPPALLPLAAALRRCGRAAAIAGLVLGGAAAGAQQLPRTRPAPVPPAPAASAAAEAPLPIDLIADRVTAKQDAEAVASGKVQMRRADVTVTADELKYDQRTDRVHADGHIRVSRGADWFTGRTLDMQVQATRGELDDAEYQLGRTGSGGFAKRFLIDDREHATALDASYTSCTRAQAQTPDWVLTGDRIDIDNTRGQGTAHGAVLRFLGVPILALPTMTFPVTSERKSGWLPPEGDFDNRSGLQLGVPYYFNAAQNVDATLTPIAMTKRGFALGTEARYLQPHDLGQFTAFAMPDDQVAGQSRDYLQLAHEGTSAGGGVRYSARVQRVSDDNFWKDFPHQMQSLAPRLLPVDLDASRRWAIAGVDADIATYARVQRWQTLQTVACLDPRAPTDACQRDPTALIISPYQRTPQVGVRGNGTAGFLHGDFEAEYNRFDLSDPVAVLVQESLPTNADGSPRAVNRPLSGSRVHLLAGVQGDFSSSWGRLTPRVSVNAASYHTTEPTAGFAADASRTIPTYSLDGQLSFERDTELFGRRFSQTLEPRLLYVLTPYRNQSQLPEYDTAPKDINTLSIYSENAFTGVDRVSDDNQLTTGATTRFNDLENGRELLRLGFAQRFLFRGGKVSSAEEVPVIKRDLLLWGTSTLTDAWTFDGTVEFNASTQQTERAVISTRWHPGPYRTLSATYRYASGSSEQYELGGQWPVFTRERKDATAGGCHGTLYAVGRVNYSRFDSRITYAVGGFEYDAGCWVGRVIVERQSTARNESNTHLMLQLELVGLSNLGAGSLRVLKDNIPGYQPLRDDAAAATPRATTP